MKAPRFLPLLLIAATPLLAQDADFATAPTSAPASEPSRDLVLRGIDRIFLEVSLGEGARPEDAELRADLRDFIELELRRAGIVMREGLITDPALSRSPTLRLEVKFDRGAGRFAARLNLAVRDQVTVTRNRTTLLAEVWTSERSVSSAIDSGLSRDIRQRAREMTGDFITALRKANAAR